MNEMTDGRGGATKLLDGIDRIIARLEEVIMAIGVILMAVNTIANVISRFVFDHSLIFSEELNSVFILLVTFAGIGYAARKGRHIRMSAIYDAMPHGMRRVLMIIITSVTAALMLFLAWFAVAYLLSLYSQGRIYPALGIPVYVSYLWVPIGLLVTGIQYALTAWHNLRSDGSEIWLSTQLAESDENADVPHTEVER